MNEHAKKIWLAWVNGTKENQYFDQVHEEWVGGDPNEFPLTKQPQNAPCLWRIKPKLKPIHIEYKIALMTDNRYNANLDDPKKIGIWAVEPEDCEYIEQLTNFVAWATDLLSADAWVEVEQ